MNQLFQQSTREWQRTKEESFAPPHRGNGRSEQKETSRGSGGLPPRWVQWGLGVFAGGLLAWGAMSGPAASDGPVMTAATAGEAPVMRADIIDDIIDILEDIVNGGDDGGDGGG